MVGKGKAKGKARQDKGGTGVEGGRDGHGDSVQVQHTYR